MSSLPVAAVLPELLSALQHAPQVLLNAPTGAGKSTWLPLQILAESNIAGRIILLEPRRLAARNVAQRLAELLGEKPGETVGFRMRAETCVGPQTRLEVVTEGILTRMIQRDPELTGVGLVILDEFHERSLQADLALALLLDVQQGLRDDLKLLIMSATLDNDRLQRLLPEAPVVVSEGRAYPVERRFSPLSAQQRFDEAVAVAAAELLRHEQGSMLLFLPGVGEIQRVLEQLTERVAEDVILCPLYGALPLSEQRKAILPAPAGKRKVVLATNIAETSLTIEGIRLVVDSAQERVARFDPRTGLTRLVTQRISQASMTQRAGRAGRLSPGICLHLLGKEQAERAAAQSEPEILHSDLSALLLELLQWGCHDPAALAWLDQPPAVNLAAARRLLEALSALDGFSIGMGATCAMFVLGSLREILGNGTLFDGADSLLGSWAKVLRIEVFHTDTPFLLAMLPPGAFIGLGMMLAIKYLIDERSKQRKAQAARAVSVAPSDVTGKA